MENLIFVQCSLENAFSFDISQIEKLELVHINSFPWSLSISLENMSSGGIEREE